jgi:hypothetical protein
MVLVLELKLVAEVVAEFGDGVVFG